MRYAAPTQLTKAIRADRISTMFASGSGMRFRNSILFIAICAAASGATFSFHVLGDDPGSWPAVLSSIGLVQGGDGVVVAPAGTAASDWAARVERGTILVLEGESPL